MAKVAVNNILMELLQLNRVRVTVGYRHRYRVRVTVGYRHRFQKRKYRMKFAIGGIFLTKRFQFTKLWLAHVTF